MSHVTPDVFRLMVSGQRAGGVWGPVRPCREVDSWWGWRWAYTAATTAPPPESVRTSVRAGHLYMTSQEREMGPPCLGGAGLFNKRGRRWEWGVQGGQAVRHLLLPADRSRCFRNSWSKALLIARSKTRTNNETGSLHHRMSPNALWEWNVCWNVSGVILKCPPPHHPGMLIGWHVWHAGSSEQFN